MGRSIIDIIFFLFLFIATLEDIRYQTISDKLSLGIILLGFLNLLIFKENFEVKIIGMGVYPIIFLLIYGYGDSIFNQEIIGYGDIKILASIGFYLNYQGLYRLLIFYNIIFLLSGIYGLICKFYLKKKEVPFIPVISLGSLIFYFLA